MVATPRTSAGQGRKRAAPGDKRAAIARAALEMFVERGFYGIAVPEIAERAGVGAGTIYRYFESKDALVNGVYREEKARFGAAIAQIFAKAPAIAREQFRALWMAMASYAMLDQESFIFLEMLHHAPYLDADSRAVEARMNEMFVQLVRATQSRGELKTADPTLLLGIVMGAFIGVIRSSIERGQIVSEGEWKFAEQCVWEAIRG